MPNKSKLAKLTIITTINEKGHHYCHGEVIGEPNLIAESLFQSAHKYPKVKAIIYKAFELWITAPKPRAAKVNSKKKVAPKSKGKKRIS